MAKHEDSSPLELFLFAVAVAASAAVFAAAVDHRAAVSENDAAKAVFSQTRPALSQRTHDQAITVPAGGRAGWPTQPGAVY